VCQELEEKKDELKQHSIFILPDDKDTDYEFYVLVGDDNSDNEFLKELFNFLNSSNNKFADDKHKEELKKWLGITGDNDRLLKPLNWLKIAIERYPYRLFVAVDNPNNYKEASQKSKFLNQRICWIKKEDLEKAFLNKKGVNLLEIKKLNNDNKPNGENLLKDFKTYQRGVLWLYYKWIEHIMEITQKNEEKRINIYVEIDGRSDYFITITSPFKEKTVNDNNTYSISKRIFYGMQLIKFNKIFPNNPQITFSRHETLAISNLFPFVNFIYSQGYSGSQFQYNIIIPSTDGFNQFYKTMLFVENALFKKLIFDERFQNFYTSQTKKVKQKLICSGLFPVKEIKTIVKIKVETIFNFDKGEGIVLKKENKKNNAFEIEKGDIKTIMGKLHPEIYNGNYLYLLIIHQGILDKIKVKNPRKLILDLKNTFPFIQITSGRGKPENVPKGEKFIEFSNIDQLMKEYSEDLILTKIAFKVIAKEE
jgi:hypothetical protein